ncbi:LysR family transcriptional regulator [Sphingobium sp. CFD-2]|uniref:LysR family transcriptional regulator n=1 Tax=Sphingobium sp. CFD-2 TaxID=2878542 RepID=UPI00214C2C12|nr:LysR family transcriptional regulator [Sphingobium sp. CFD-2]
MIERYLIHYFLAVMDQGNFSRAAQQCRVSQPTLSVGIAKLEGLVGHSLFHRTNRRVELTRFGVTFATHARRIEAEFAMAAQAMAADKRNRLIRIGVISSLPSTWLEAATREASLVEGERVEILEGRMRELVPRLERGRIDVIVGLLGNEVQARDILFEEGYALALPAFHPLAHRKMLEPEEVADAEMIVRRNCESLSDVSRFFTQRGVRPFFSARTTNDDRAISFVRAGLGITVMPRCFAQPGIVMPALSGFDQRRRVGIVIDPRAKGRIDSSQSFQRLTTTIRSTALAIS